MYKLAHTFGAGPVLKHTHTRARVYTYTYVYKGKGKGNIHPRTGHEAPEEE